MDMQDLASTLFKPFTLVVIRLEGGDSIQGTVVLTDDGSIVVEQADGTRVTVDQDLLERAEYCYMGFPTLQEREIPLEVHPNGIVSSFSNDSGFIETDSGKKYHFFTNSLVDPVLFEQAMNGSIVGEKVLFISGGVVISSIIKAGSLDQVLDTISAIAKNGKVKLAKELCALVKQQFPNVEDVDDFEMALDEAIKQAKGIDLYAPIPSKTGFLKPSGRIYKFVKQGNEKGGIIIDYASHQELFFFEEQLFGELYDEPDDKLIGRPVVYSVKKVASGKYQARTVLPSVRYNEAYDIAKDLKKNYPEFKLNAFDILRIINKQTKDLEYEQIMSDWGEDRYIQERIWHSEKLPEYQGDSASLYITPTRMEKLETPELNRSTEHTHIVQELTRTPEPPSILSPKEMEELMKAAVASKPEPEPEVELMPEQKNTEEVNNNTEDKDSEIENESPVEDIRILHTELPSLEDCPDGEQMVPANARLTLVWGDGSVSMKGSEQEYVFSTEDIIDESLKQRAGVLTIIKDEPIVCQLLHHDFRAEYICSPMTVLKMLSAARDAIVSAEDLAKSGDREGGYELYDKALGYVLNVLQSYSTNTVALSLRDIVEDAIKQYMDQCYISPFNGLSPCGTVSVVKSSSSSVPVLDARFVDPLYLNRSAIIDRDYPEIREGDELVYSVYPRGSKGGIQVRFVCLARPASELLTMAGRWEEEEAYENAWAIAKLVLEDQPDNKEAQVIVQSCEPYVSEDTILNWQRVIRDNKYAQGVTALHEKRYADATESFIDILEEDSNWMDQKRLERLRSQSVHRLIESYQEWYAKCKDENVRKDYRRDGEQYLLGKEGSSFVLRDDTLENCDLLISFYKDMENPTKLVEAYRKKLSIFNKRPNKNSSKRESKKIYAELYAQIAWNLLVIGNTDEAAQEIKYASNNEVDLLPKNNREKNSLIPICDAIIFLRNGGEKRVRNEAKFAILDSIPIDSRFADKMYSGTGPMESFSVERYALLSAIVNLRYSINASNELLYLVGRYLATLTCNQEEYKQYLSSTKLIPDDCNFVEQVFKCLERKATWRSWRDIRLLCMLSEEAAYNICAALYTMNRNLATSLLVYYGIDVKENRNQFKELKNFAELFAGWRGANLQEKYVTFIKKYAELSGSFSFDECLEFLSELEYQQWMIPDDMEVVNEIHWELPGQIREFKAAANSRAIRMGSKDILKNISKWTSSMIERPTVLMMSSLQPILLLIAREVKRVDEQYQSCEPEISCDLLTSSALAEDNSMYIEVKIHNKQRNAEPMSDCKLRLLPTEDIVPDEIMPVFSYTLTDKVFGDEYLLYILHFSLKPDYKQTGLKAQIRFEYKVKSEYKTKGFSVPFKPLPPKSYKRILNDYNYGGVEREHFYGREATIENAVHTLSKKGEAPHYFIYGQKRSGKTSVMFQILDRMAAMNDPLHPSSIIVELDFSQFIDSIKKEEDLYYYMLRSIIDRVKKTINKLNRSLSKTQQNAICEIDEKVLEVPQGVSSVSFIQFVERLEDINEEFSDNTYLENCKIILFVDEFTCAYNWLIDGFITKDFMFRWKVMQKRRLFAAILIGQDILRDFIRKCNSPNPFEVLEKERLGYLSPEEARRMVVDKITGAMGKDEGEIFVGNALPRILEYSASSAFYTKWICQRLVNLLNQRRQNQITEIDVDSAVWELLSDNGESDDKFDALFLPGLDNKVAIFSKEQVMDVMDVVADEQMANPISGCQRSTLLTLGNVTEGIIQDLLDRDVIIDPRNNGYYFVKVKLYVIWRKIRTTRIL